MEIVVSGDYYGYHDYKDYWAKYFKVKIFI